MSPVISRPVVLLFSMVFLTPALMAGEVKPKSTSQQTTQRVNVGTNEVGNEAGVIDEDAEIEGVTIINGSVSIDGVRVPHGVRKFRSVKTGRSYRIDWGKDGNVSVIEQ